MRFSYSFQTWATLYSSGQSSAHWGHTQLRNPLCCAVLSITHHQGNALWSLHRQKSQAMWRHEFNRHCFNVGSKELINLEVMNTLSLLIAARPVRRWRAGFFMLTVAPGSNFALTTDWRSDVQFKWESYICLFSEAQSWRDRCSLERCWSTSKRPEKFRLKRYFLSQFRFTSACKGITNQGRSQGGPGVPVIPPFASLF